MNYIEAREKRKRIFEDTRRMYLEDEELLESIQKSRDYTRFYRAEDIREKVEASERNRFIGRLSVSVTRNRSFEAAEKLFVRYPGSRIAVLNFASPTMPGGGVVSGSGAQEECLCRTSTLYPVLTTRRLEADYYLKNRRACSYRASDDVIYTPGIVVFKEDSLFPTLKDRTLWKKFDVITSAAPNISREVSVDRKELEDIFESRINSILGVALLEKVDVLVLGAFGCGAFGNDPRLVSKVFRKVLQDYGNSFRAVEFAVYCYKIDENYLAFRNTFATF